MTFIISFQFCIPTRIYHAGALALLHNFFLGGFESSIIAWTPVQTEKKNADSLLRHHNTVRSHRRSWSCSLDWRKPEWNESCSQWDQSTFVSFSYGLRSEASTIEVGKVSAHDHRQGFPARVIFQVSVEIQVLPQPLTEWFLHTTRLGILKRVWVVRCRLRGRGFVIKASSELIRQSWDAEVGEEQQADHGPKRHQESVFRWSYLHVLQVIWSWSMRSGRGQLARTSSWTR
jgi:hypothetical protein